MAKKKRNRWKPVYGYEGLYEICTNSRIKNVKTGKILKPYVNDNGYLVVRLHDKDGNSKIKRVHRLLMLSFVGPDPERPIVNHKNGIKLDLDLDNLEWCTSSENNKHAFAIGLNTRDCVKHEFFVKVGDFEFTVLGAREAAKILHDHGYFTDTSIVSLATSLTSCALHHTWYRGVLQCMHTSDPFDFDSVKPANNSGSHRREMLARLPSGLTVKGHGATDLARKMKMIGFWRDDTDKWLAERCTNAAKTNVPYHGIRIWYVDKNS